MMEKDNFKKIISYPSVIFLLFVNLIPVTGLLFYNWDAFTIVLLYWMESAVIGFFNVLKMIKINGSLDSPLIPMFIVHYVIFMFLHLFFIIVLFKPSLELAKSQLDAFLIVGEYFGSILISLIFLFISHGLSFTYNFLKKREFETSDLKQQMFMPYKRIIIMHIVVLASSFYVASGTIDILPIIIMVLLKTFFDLRAHIKEHSRLILVNK